MRQYVEPFWRRWVEFRNKQAAVALLLLGIGFGLLSLAIRLPGLNKIDWLFTHELQENQWPPLKFVMIGFTFLGNTLTIVLLAFGLAAFLFWRGRRVAGIFTVLTLIGFPLNMLLKDWVGRPRPGHDLVSVVLPTVGLSFPSGHAMGSTMFYGYLALLCWVHIADRVRRIEYALCFALTAIMVGLSRIWLGAHWLSDVIGGITAGTFCLMVIAMLYRRWAKKELPDSPKPKKAYRIIRFRSPVRST